MSSPARSIGSDQRAGRVILIGLRCSGKTTVAQLLADRIGTQPIDLDHFALERTGRRSISDVFRELGEAAWRDAEAAALTDVIESGFRVLALGGGTPMIPTAVLALREMQRQQLARIVYLRATPETLSKRRERAVGDRPSLTGRNPTDEMNILFRERDARYRELADLVIETDLMSPEEIADQIDGDGYS